VHEVERLDADELAFAVVVRPDQHLVHLGGEGAEGVRDRGLADALLWRRADKGLEGRVLPGVERLRVVQLDDVPAEPHDNIVDSVAIELEGGDTAVLPVELAMGEDDGEPQGCRPLLSHDKNSHGQAASETVVFKALVIPCHME